MTVRDTSLIAFDEIRERLAPDEDRVFAVLLELGPCHDRRILEALNQSEAAEFKPAEARRTWEINSVTGRRNALIDIHGVIEDIGQYTGLWNGRKKTYHFWRVAGDKRLPAGWEKVEQEPQFRQEPTGQLVFA